MSVAGDIIDELKFDLAVKAQAVTFLSGVLAISIFVVIGVFGVPENSAHSYIGTSGTALENADIGFADRLI